MARPSVAARNLSLMEELEKLEQSITLTLQEIDHNFSKSHRIVTTSIIPVVEQYGEHSRAVWEASKFWKQFFEASANVSLSGYEELANDDESSLMEESTAMRDETTTDYTPSHAEDDEMSATPAGGTNRDTAMHGDESLLDDAELTGSTPRPPATKTIRAEVSHLGSPYDTMKRDMKAEEDGTTVLQDTEDSTVLFAQRTAQLPDMSMTPRGQRGDHGEQLRHSEQRRNKDPLLHRVLDKNYRVQATPHRPAYRVSPLKKDDAASPAKKEKEKAKEKSRATWQDDSPMSSPDMAPPTLRSEVFMSPYKLMARQRMAQAGGAGSGAGASTSRAAAAAAAAASGPRTPGVSVQTPAAMKKSRDIFASSRKSGDGGAAAAEEDKSRGRQRYEIDWDSDEDDDDLDLYAGMSPPKTIQFALPPSKLLQTPAREASRRIVDDILIDAGADTGLEEYSPTMVKMNEDILNDSF